MTNDDKTASLFRHRQRPSGGLSDLSQTLLFRLSSARIIFHENLTAWNMIEVGKPQATGLNGY